jgi:putative transposase
MTHDLSMRRKMLEAGHEDLSLSKQCKILALHRSGIYHKPKKEKDENLSIMRIMDEMYFETPFYGVEKLRIELGKKGFNVNRKRLRRLMKLQGWKTLYAEPKTTITDKKSYKYPYLLKGLKIERKNQVWEIDITYIPMQRGFMYLFAIIDVHSRYIVGWDISNSMTAEWCVEIINGAIEMHGKPEIMNSDQGCQFTSNLYTKTLIDADIKISMDSKGRAIDNIYIERFWRSIKYENIYLKAYETGKELYQGVHDYIEFYNKKRSHQSLNYLVPSELYCMRKVA